MRKQKIKLGETEMKNRIKREFRYAFVKSVPVMCAYIFLGIAFGILLQEAGYNFIWAFIMSAFVFAGSMQFVMVPLLVSGVSPLTMAVTTLFVNCRHIFYGISFVESFNKMKQKLYMIFSLTDETYSVLCSCKNEDPEEEHRDAWFFIAAIDQAYWVIGSVIGAWLGNILPFDFTGIDFAMTALFIVILLEQIIGSKAQPKVAAAIGVIVAFVCLFIFGADRFLLPSMLITVFLLSLYSNMGNMKAAIQEEGDYND